MVEQRPKLAQLVVTQRAERPTPGPKPFRELLDKPATALGGDDRFDPAVDRVRVA